MSERVDGPDYFRDVRRTVALLVLVFDFLFFIPLCYALVQVVARRGEGINLGGPVPWLLFAAQYAFITASVLPAVRIFRTEDRRRSWRLTGWMALLFLVGVGLTFALVIYADSRNSIAGQP